MHTADVPKGPALVNIVFGSCYMREALIKWDCKSETQTLPRPVSYKEHHNTHDAHARTWK